MGFGELHAAAPLHAGHQPLQHPSEHLMQGRSRLGADGPPLSASQWRRGTQTPVAQSCSNNCWLSVNLHGVLNPSGATTRSHPFDAGTASTWPRTPRACPPAGRSRKRAKRDSWCSCTVISRRANVLVLAPRRREGEDHGHLLASGANLKGKRQQSCHASFG